MSPTEKVNEADHLVCRCRRRSFVLVVESGEAQAQDLISSRTVLGAVISINSLRVLMTSRLKPTRRRFLLNTGMLAAGFELSCTDAVLTRELAPTPSCRDGDEPTIRQTEGPFFKPRSPERSDLREPGARGRGFELSGFVLTKSGHPLRRPAIEHSQDEEQGEQDNNGL